MLNKKDLEGLVEKAKEDRDHAKSEYEKNSCKGGYEPRYYLSEIKLHIALIKKAKKELNYCDKKLDLSLWKLVGYSISRIRGYKRKMDEIRRKLKESFNNLEEFREKYGGYSYPEVNELITSVKPLIKIF